MKRWRVIDTGYLDCYSNMAIDEALLESYDIANRLPVLRIYGWKPEAFSIGYSQNPQDELDLDRCKLKKIDFVRRITGGGVIFHKSELTYSVVCSRDDIGFFTFSKEIYRALCSFLIKTYQDLGLKAEYSLKESTRRTKSWFCFTERERYDILINGKKIGGNAQRRKKEIIFQHGSIPLRPNVDQALGLLRNYPTIDKTSIISLSEALGKDISYNRLKVMIVESFAKVFGVDIVESSLNPKEKALYRFFLNEKYAKKEWNLCRDVGNSKACVA